MTQKNIGNKKAQRSQQQISKVLLELMNEKSFDDITISELTEKAGLARRTFYRNYSSKEEIIITYLIDFWNEYDNEMAATDDHSLRNTALVFFNKLEEHKDMLILFNNNNLLTLFLNNISELMEASYKRRDNLEELHHISSDEIHTVSLFVAGGFFQVAINWLNHGAIETPEQLAQSIDSINKVYQLT